MCSGERVRKVGEESLSDIEDDQYDMPSITLPLTKLKRDLAIDLPNQNPFTMKAKKRHKLMENGDQQRISADCLDPARPLPQDDSHTLSDQTCQTEDPDRRLSRSVMALQESRIERLIKRRVCKRFRPTQPPPPPPPPPSSLGLHKTTSGSRRR
ncbi:hypothetical protein RRG08_008620 [Elysia crispata]|uniref:Uncharacterized protein n=1 Tax=Elysia crispata TaxID=231223 RepID=A0AAE1EB11_9GAST|nr:hypothetical protein RRG08_008620 [Elysia crispata]